jgi:hypothetical protein
LQRHGIIIACSFDGIFWIAILGGRGISPLKTAIVIDILTDYML